MCLYFLTQISLTYTIRVIERMSNELKIAIIIIFSSV